MTFRVSRSVGVTVQPSEPTPSETLNLSVLDKLPTFGSVSMMNVHRQGHEAARVIREALSKVLVPYYPLAGRLKGSSHGDLQVACTGEGAWFIEASADYTLASVNYFHEVVVFNYDDLLPIPPPESSGMDPILQIQVTSFRCGGFTIGLTSYHSLVDGIGGAMFMSAMGEFARGFQYPTIKPVWLREAIPAPARLVGQSKLAPTPPPSFPSFQLENAIIDISLGQINKLKKEFLECFDDHCSSFDVVLANLWQQRTRAIELEKHTEVSLIFTVNAREFLTPPLPKGFYGNCIFPLKVTISSGRLLEASSAEVVKLIKDVKARGPSEFRKWAVSEEDTEDPFVLTLAYTTLCVAQWGRLGFDKVDYGWGYPEQVFAVQQGPCVIPYAVVGSPPTEKKGIRLMTSCVTKAHLPSFLHSYTKGPSSRL